ncbi:hypothetical protein HGA92_01595 [Candidatus Gracilibacteria bacterium]|nr:hypothetical protein [Candidatus Gracilibacteria bacterium]NUJ98696.1 hypothetical protein [Candidatus Gracilibacteria bacterium]
MLFDFLKKQSRKESKIRILKTMIFSLQVGDDIKELYIQSLDILDDQNIDKLFQDITYFTEKIELKEIEDIQKNSFATVNNMTKKEAEEKKKDINTFSFLLNNL